MADDATQRCEAREARSEPVAAGGPKRRRVDLGSKAGAPSEGAATPAGSTPLGKAGIAQMVKALLQEPYRTGKLARDDFKSVARAVTERAGTGLASLPAESAEVQLGVQRLVKDALAKLDI